MEKAKEVKEIKKEEKTYTVEKGENIYSVAHKHNMTWRELHEMNKKVIGKDHKAVKEDMKLKIK